MFNGNIHYFDWTIFNSHVKLPEGNTLDNIKPKFCPKDGYYGDTKLAKLTRNHGVEWGTLLSDVWKRYMYSMYIYIYYIIVIY